MEIKEFFKVNYPVLSELVGFLIDVPKWRASFDGKGTPTHSERMAQVGEKVYKLTFKYDGEIVIIPVDIKK
jgi:hypothetical protein